MPEDALLAPAAEAVAGLRGAAIVSVGASLPAHSVSNDEVAARIGKTDEWISRAPASARAATRRPTSG